MKTQRVDAARETKREFGHLYSEARPKALRDSRLRILGQAVVLGSGGAGIVAIGILASPRATPPRSPSATVARPPSPALLCAPPVRPPSPREPPVINVTITLKCKIIFFN
ncbi:hypothetical protein PHYSODRAFT_307931 [Phytophthora sojae]|uniref:Uncharacterized protein n=1 Tax=Phytophthora sojae (strain P6497) TaxID=1094619 RepID=G5AH69_PHYSP|nr:hypothetical protein PHYSODRAFT_307931 [Phytophthora sojae]EGZ05048.1 hypothetical protein PHYSODRAFT_307931 [Phytophthora sojae]|eukprot:XP_009539420.1 hypothetical protein PHYSODRAFT_307931 [Phytophthora sojae]